MNIFGNDCFRPMALGIVVLAVSFTMPSHVSASIVDFSGVNLSAVSSASGQDFSYVIGTGPAIGTLNVRRLSGDISSLQTGLSPDPTGIYVLQQSPNLTPVTLRFTFDAATTFDILENETVAQLEKNTFSMPSGTWTLLSSQDANVNNSGSVISIVGDNNTPPWGGFSIQGTSQTFDWEIDNSPGFPTFGSAISINAISTVPEPGAIIIWGAIFGFAAIARFKHIIV